MTEIDKEMVDFDILSCMKMHYYIQNSIQDKVDILVSSCTGKNPLTHVTYSKDSISIHYLFGNSRLTYLFDPFNESYTVNIYSPKGNRFLIKRLLSIEELKSYILIMVSYYKNLFDTEEDKKYLNRSIVDLYDNFVNKTCLKYMLEI